MFETHESKISYLDESDEIPVKVVGKNKQHRPAPEDKAPQTLSQLLEEDRFWATLAHALGPIMMGLVIFTDSMAWLLALMLTAGIYFYHAGKSEFVRYHARQALVLQMMGTFGWLILLLSGVAIWVVALLISTALMLVLIGFILTPIVLVAGPILFLMSFLLPLSVILFGTIGAWETWHGREFHYPYLADRLGKWSEGKRKPKPKDMIIV